MRTEGTHTLPNDTDPIGIVLMSSFRVIATQMSDLLQECSGGR